MSIPPAPKFPPSQKLALYLLKNCWVRAGTKTSGPAKGPAVVRGMLICSGKQNQWEQKRQLLNKILKRNRSEESGETETFNPEKIIMTEWKMIFIPSYLDFEHSEFFYGLELLPSRWIMELSWRLFAGVTPSLNLRLTDGSKSISQGNYFKDHCFQ